MELSLIIGGNTYGTTSFDAQRAQYASNVAQSVCQQIISAGFKNCVVEIEGQRFALGFPGGTAIPMSENAEKGSEYKVADLYRAMEKLYHESDAFKYGEWSVESVGYDCSLRIMYGRRDIMTVRFYNKRERQIIFRGEYTDVAKIAIGGRDTHYRAPRNPTMITATTRLNQINWESMDPLGDEILDCILAMLKKYK